MRATYTLLTADQLVLCATNESALYNRHLELAAAKASTAVWCCHILDRVLPHLSGPTGGYRGERLACLELELAAEQLAEYYNLEVFSGNEVVAG